MMQTEGLTQEEIADKLRKEYVAAVDFVIVEVGISDKDKAYKIKEKYKNYCLEILGFAHNLGINMHTKEVLDAEYGLLELSVDANLQVWRKCYGN